jgi:BlaI family transcriptional regulator, penicillinase repressor
VSIVPRISDAEWTVMQVVWERAPVTAAEVVRELTPRTGWNHRTVRTMLDRLLRKGALVRKEDGGRSVYSPRVPRDRCVREETRSFLHRVFRDDPASLLLHFVEQCDLSRTEIDGLRRVLDRKAGGKED